jgi:hypothetical protein
VTQSLNDAILKGGGFISEEVEAVSHPIDHPGATEEGVVRAGERDAPRMTWHPETQSLEATSVCWRGDN